MTTPETYARHRATADRLIARYGGGAVLVRMEGGAEPQNPWDPPGDATPVAYPVQFIETGYQLDYQAGTLIQAGDVLGVIAAPASITPLLSDTFRHKGMDYTIVDLKPVQPSPDALVLQFAIQARR